MNLYEAQDFFKKMYPDKLVIFEFDKNCIKQLEIIHTDGGANPIHHVEYEKVKVSTDGVQPQYVPIAPHRMCMEWQCVKDHVNNLSCPEKL